MSKKINLFVIATSDHAIKITDELKANKDINISLWLGRKGQDYCTSTISRMSTRRTAKGHVMDQKYYEGSINEMFTGEQKDKLHRLIHKFVDNLYRRDELYSARNHKLKTYHQYVDYFYILADVMATKIKAEKIDAVLFYYMPHLAYDTIAYFVAQILGIKTVILSQSIFPDKFYIYDDVNNYGNFTFDNLDKVEPFKIEKGENMQHFYMKDIKQEREEGGKLSVKNIGRVLYHVIRKSPDKLYKPKELAEVFKKANKVRANFPKWRDPFAKYFHENDLEFFETIAEFEENPIELDKDFIYFPLQLQPEATTSSIGDIYVDQALAIEHLSTILPDDVLIYVKENPKQGAFMRDHLFFHRLARVKNVRIMPSFANTNALLDNCKFVAAVTGTAGYEALRKGKPALVFGNSWYKNLIGAFRFDFNLKYKDIINFKIDHELLEKQVGSMLSQMGNGLVDKAYNKITEIDDMEANYKKVAEQIGEYLQN